MSWIADTSFGGLGLAVVWTVQTGIVIYLGLALRKHFVPPKGLSARARSAWIRHCTVPHTAAIAAVILALAISTMHPEHELFPFLSEMQRAEANVSYALTLGVVLTTLLFTLESANSHIIKTLCILGIALITVPGLDPHLWTSVEMLAGGTGKVLSFAIGLAVYADKSRAAAKRSAKAEMVKPRVSRATSVAREGNVIQLKRRNAAWKNN